MKSKRSRNKKKCVVLLSGGLDSAVTLFEAKRQGFDVNCLIFNYGQRHCKEIEQAKKIARSARCSYKMLKIALPWKGSALVDKNVALPKNSRIDPNKIPSTYVPARNIIFLSFAASFAEAIRAHTIFIGANAIDYSGYPDCRPEFFEAFSEALKKGLKTGVKGKRIKIITPLIRKTKSQIISMGKKLDAPLHLTWSCYKGGKRPCGTCDSCKLREKGFAALKMGDPAH